MTKQNTKDNIELSHSIKLFNGNRIVVCNGHFCDLHGISEYEYLKRKRGLKDG